MTRRYVLAPEAALDLVQIWRYIKKQSTVEIADHVESVAMLWHVGEVLRWRTFRRKIKRKWRVARDWKKVGAEEREERFLSAQADAFAGAKAEEKVGLLRSE
jgi:plasmid stabilization system protein ParE